jgi:hypothetical protein
MRLATSLESEGLVERCGSAYICEALLITVLTTNPVLFDYTLRLFDYT